MDHTKIFVIAEAGVNHNGDMDIAKQLIDAAVHCGANAVKFQTFNAENLVTPDSKTADHQKRSGMTNQFDLLKSQEFSFDEFKEIKRYCDQKKIEFISTPYDVESVRLLDETGVKRFKIASAELVNKPVVKAIALTNKSVLLATGMSTMDEVERTVDYIKTNGRGSITLLHCTSSYPAPYDQVNMNVMQTLKNTFNHPVGYSDHTRGIEIPIMAVSMGASVIEKHFTLDQTMIGPDHWASAEPDEFKKMVDAIRNVEQAFGTHEKIVTENEKKNMLYMRRSVHAVHDIKKGETIKKEDVKILRINDGISSWDIDKVIGKTAKKDIKKYQPITWRDI